MTWKPKPCLKCGGPKPHGGGYRYCSDRCRFLNRAEINGPDDCWGWDGTHSKTGHPRMGVARSEHDGQYMISAQRISYELFNGSIPGNKVVHQTCGNVGCVNPKHLGLATWYRLNHTQPETREQNRIRRNERQRTPEYRAWHKEYRKKPDVREKERQYAYMKTRRKQQADVA